MHGIKTETLSAIGLPRSGPREGSDAVIHLAAFSNGPLRDHRLKVTSAIDNRTKVLLAALANTPGSRCILRASSGSNGPRWRDPTHPPGGSS